MTEPSVWVIDFRVASDIDYRKGKLLRGDKITKEIDRVLLGGLGGLLGFNEDEDEGWVRQDVEVYDSDGQESDLHEIPDSVKVIFLHLGDNDCGNERSVGFYEKIKKQRTNERKIYVIGYTGGNCARPENFEDCDQNMYFTLINGPENLNLPLFFSAWAKDIDESPPFECLRKFPTLPIAFHILCTGSKIAHKPEEFEKLSEGLKDQARRHSGEIVKGDWWKPVLGEDLKGTRLLKEFDEHANYYEANTGITRDMIMNVIEIVNES